MANPQNKNFDYILKDKKENIAKIFKYILVLAVSFALAKLKVLGQLSPVGLCFVSACPNSHLLFAAIGAVFGYLLNFLGFETIRYILALAAVSFIKILMKKINIINNWNKFFMPVISALCCAVTGLALCIAQGFTFEKTVKVIIDSLFCIFAVYVLSCAMLLKKSKILSSRKNLICVLTSACVLLIPFYSISFYSFIPARAFSALLILLFSYVDDSIGAICGISFGVLTAFSSDYMNICPLYSILGITSSFFKKYGRTAYALFFTSLCVLNALIYPTGEAAAVIAESALASLMFILLRKETVEKIRDKTQFEKYNDTQNCFELIESKIEKMKNSLLYVGQKVKSVSNELEKIEKDSEDTASAVFKKVCSSCPNTFLCCKRDSIRQKEFYKFSEIIKEKYMIDESDVSFEFKSLCPRYKEIKRAYVSTFAKNNLSSVQSANNLELRTVLSDEIASAADILDDVLLNIGAKDIFLEKETFKIAQIANIAEIKISKCRCVKTLSGKKVITLILKNTYNRSSVLNFINITQKEMNINLSAPLIKENENALIFEEKLAYKFNVGVYQQPGGKSELCGDSFEIFGSEDSVQTVILSDGMGTGGRAAVDSTVTVKLFSSLVSSGISYKTALKIINSALIAKSQEETLSTLDVASLNPFSGEITIYKAGGAPSFIRNGNRIFSVSQSSLPAGILRDIKFSASKVSLLKDDILLMISDGALCSDLKIIEKELSDKSAKAQTLCENIAHKVRENQAEQKKDDLTVICVKVQEY